MKIQVTHMELSLMQPLCQISKIKYEKSKPCNNLRRRSEQSSQNSRHVVVNINHKCHAKYSLTFDDLHQNALQGIPGPQ